MYSQLVTAVYLASLVVHDSGCLKSICMELGAVCSHYCSISCVKKTSFCACHLFVEYFRGRTQTVYTYIMSVLNKNKNFNLKTLKS